MRADDRGRPASALAGLAAAMVAAVVLAAGCSGGSGASSSQPLGASAADSTSEPSVAVTPSADSSALATPSPNPAQQRVAAANQALSGALAQLTAAEAKRDQAMSFSAARQAMNSGMSSARAHLRAERSAAYGGVRSCSGVNAHAAAVRSAVSRVYGGRGQLRATTARVRAEARKVEAARQLVQKRLAALQGALRAAPNRDVAPVVGQVQQALTAGVTRAKQVSTELAAAEAQANGTAASAAHLRYQAGLIQTRAC